MKNNQPFLIREYGYLLDGVDSGSAANAVGIPHAAFKSLLANLHDENQADDFQIFLKLTTYQRKPALKVQNYVGVIQTPCGTQIEVLPKLVNNAENEESVELTRNQLLLMLRTLRDSPFRKVGWADIRDVKMPLLEVYISQFLLLVNQLVKRGIRSDYVLVNRNTKYLKGRLLVGQQIRKNAFHHELFCVEYQEYQINRPANRLIKTALQLVSKVTHNSQNQRLSRELGFVFDQVPKSQDVKADFQNVRTDRTMGYYKDVLSWSKLLLMGHGPTASSGDFSTLSLLYPMERIFEDYVAHCLRKDLDQYFSEGSILKTQARRYSLVESHDGKPIFNLRPDLLIIKDKQNICVMDTKWKLLNANDRRNKYGISQADMYQLYAYGHKYLKGTGIKNLKLIYPKTDTFTEPLPTFIYEDGFTLDVVPFDITKGVLLLN